MKNFIRSKLFIFILVIILLITFFLLTIVFNFECPLYMHFHIKCPFCGARKMILSLLRFNIVESFNSNQLLFIVLPISFLLLFIKHILNKDIRIPKMVYVLLIIITIIFTVVRNII